MPSWVLDLVPAGAAILLAIPCWSFTYLWDDFDFLERAERFRLTQLLPDPSLVFYRPLSREIYFTALRVFGGATLAMGHLANTLLLASATVLVTLVTRRLAGARAGILAGASFASLGALPILIGWLSGVQDLLAIVFVLLALLWRGRRDALALASMAAAMLSKEVAVAAVPLVAVLPWVTREKPARLIRGCLPYVLLLIAWGAIHPGIRLLFAGHAVGEGGSGGYVAVGAPGRGTFLLRSLLTMGNLPVTGTSTPWPGGRAGVALLAALLLSFAILRSGSSMGPGRSPVSEEAAEAPSRRRVAIVATLLALATTTLTAVLVRRWSPYYAAMPAVGTSILLGMALDRLPTAGALAFLLAFLGLGTWCRGTVADTATTTERNLEVTSQALERVRLGFLSLRPAIPSHTQALLSVAGTGAQSVTIHLLRYQALQVWYGDPTIESRSPERRMAWSGPEDLFRVTPTLDVIEIGTQPLTYRSSENTPGPGEVDRPIRAYVRGLAASGEPDRAVALLLALERMDSPTLQPYDRRLAGMILYQAGRPADAERTIAGVPLYPRDIAIQMIGKILVERPGAPSGTDSVAFLAFGVEPDAEAYRRILRRADQVHDATLASYTARRVLAYAPEDEEAKAVLAKLASTPAPQRITEPGAEPSP